MLYYVIYKIVPVKSAVPILLQHEVCYIHSTACIAHNITREYRTTYM